MYFRCSLNSEVGKIDSAVKKEKGRKALRLEKTLTIDFILPIIDCNGERVDKLSLLQVDCNRFEMS